MTLRRGLLGLILLAAALTVAPAGASAAARPAIGIGDQHPLLFTSPYWRKLEVKHGRYITPWDALKRKWSRDELDTYMNAARAANVRVLLGFGHSRSRSRHTAPTVRQFTKAFKGFRARYPWIRDYLTWNEANHCGEPTCRKPGLVARFYNVIRARCQGCKVVGADVLDTSMMPAWIRAFRRKVKGGPPIWGIHNYIDANRFRTSGTRSLLRAAPRGEVWFTETGGLIMRRDGNRIAFPGSVKHAARATKQVFRLARLSRRVKRVYFYHWSPSTARRPTWDSALVGKRGKPRPAYRVLRDWLKRTGAL